MIISKQTDINIVHGVTGDLKNYKRFHFEGYRCILAQINNGTIIITIFKNSDGKRIKGKKVLVIRVKGVSYLKIDNNDIEKDNLENLPEFKKTNRYE